MRKQWHPALRAGLLVAGLAGLIAANTLPAAGQDYYTGGSRYSSEQSNPPNYDRQNYDRQNSDQQNFDWQNNGWQNNGWQNNGWQNDGWQNNNRNDGNSWQNRGWQERNHQALSRNDIRRQLARQNYQNLSHWKFGNGFYWVNAEDRRGRDFRLVVNAYSGRIVDVQRRR